MRACDTKNSFQPLQGCRNRGQGAGVGGQSPLPGFSRSVNPIPTRGRADYTHYITTRPPDFQHLSLYSKTFVNLTNKFCKARVCVVKMSENQIHTHLFVSYFVAVPILYRYLLCKVALSESATVTLMKMYDLLQFHDGYKTYSIRISYIFNSTRYFLNFMLFTNWMSDCWGNISWDCICIKRLWLLRKDFETIVLLFKVI